MAKFKKGIFGRQIIRRVFVFSTTILLLKICMSPQNQSMSINSTELSASQSLPRKIIYVFLVFVLLVIYLFPIRQLLNDSFNATSLIPVGILAVVTIFLLSCKLSVRITANYISYQFFPIHFSSRKICKEDIMKIEFKSLEPFTNFGGYGVRYDIVNKRWAYIVCGSNVLILTTVNGKQIVLGTALGAEEIADFLSLTTNIRIDSHPGK